MEASVDGAVVARGSTTVEWLEGGSFLVQRSDGRPSDDAPRAWHENAPFPTQAIVGWDDTLDRYSMLYADARGVFRLYEMSFADGTWKIWRDAPGFFQRFVANVRPDRITGAWERSDDGSDWTLDFDVLYRR